MTTVTPSSPGDSVQYLPGVGPRRAEMLKRLGIVTLEDLLYFFPRRYLDRRSFTPIASLREGSEATIRGTVLAAGLIRTRSGRPVFRLIVADSSGKIACAWFNQPYLKTVFKTGEEAIFSGRVMFYGDLQMANPEYEKVEAEDGELLSAGRIVPVYPLTEGLNQKLMRTIIRAALVRASSGLGDMLPEETRERWKVVPSPAAVNNIHYPPAPAALRQARQRLILDEFFLLQLALALQRRTLIHGRPALPHSPRTPLFDSFLRSLPFDLTRAQRRALFEIKRDMTALYPMNRLLQGDVGSGKTVVAAGGLLVTRDSGYQGAIMAPTEILAEQHFRTLTELLRPLPVTVDLLTGGVGGEERERVLQRIRTGETGIAVGTQALIQGGVEFKALGLVVVDEQHKFGVKERAELRAKGGNPHLLVMSATPIPRTLVLTMYGDLDVSVLDEMPPGRKRVKTAWIGPDALEKAYAFIRREAVRGRQAYIVYPLIEESEGSEVKAAAERFRHLAERVFPSLRLGLLHGRMPAAAKDRMMASFRSGAVQVMVSTVGADQAYCLIESSPRSEDAKQRIKILCETNDGFRIAEADLELRGTGEFFGTRQHGLPELRIGRIVADAELMEFARRQAFALIEKDPAMVAPALSRIRERVYRPASLGYCDLYIGTCL
ncbi:MAG: ATP-dependent DNA helicase RecG [Candidatus Aureabacteria bacterium]|nr:ATP-dependent DNA helicase RecG [Candidatus Auribacterota bacterium]